jgi:predicted nucleic acid-binding protein
MMRVFADSSYWIALLNPHDGLHAKALTLSRRFVGHQIVTTEMVMVEILNAFASSGKYLREKAIQIVDALRTNGQVIIIPQTAHQFENALHRYRKAGDKSWSITDCASFDIMERSSISAAITHDRHFEQAGFTALLR